MKTKIFIFLLVFFGCTPSKTTITPVSNIEKEAPVVKTKDSAVPWIRDIDESLNIADPINFYNEHKINVAGTIPIEIKMYEDGKLVYKDSSIVFDFSIPKMTKGEIVHIEKESGQIVSITVRFDIEEKNYDHIFYFKPNKTFELGTKIEIIVNEEPHTVDLVIEGDKSGKCRLMYYPVFKSEDSNIEKEASGVPNKAGEKVIK